jgi:uncharacterized protein (TIGR03067 family)
MRRTLSFAAILLLLAARAHKGQGADPASPLVGTWKVTSAIEDGLAREQSIGTIYIFKEGSFTTNGKGGEHSYSYAIDSTQTPGLIDITPLGGVRAGATRKGIYEIKDGTLKICFGISVDAKRPTALASKEGSSLNLTTMKREAGGR